MQLWEHQKKAVEKYKGSDFFGLLFDCGTGKTACATALAKEKGLPVIVIAPSVLCPQWEEELEGEGIKTFTVTAPLRKKKGFAEKLSSFLGSQE